VPPVRDTIRAAFTGRAPPTQKGKNMAEVLVYSTLTRDQRYTNYVPGGGDLPIAAGSVLIKGGANLANKHLITSRGEVTEITFAEYDMLKTNEDFKRHVANGFIYVDDSGRKAAPVDHVVDDLVARDDSAPLVPEDFHEKSEFGDKPPVVNAVVNDKPTHPSKRR